MLQKKFYVRQLFVTTLIKNKSKLGNEVSLMFDNYCVTALNKIKK